MENIIKEGYLNSLMRGVANSGSVSSQVYYISLHCTVTAHHVRGYHLLHG